MLTWMVPALSVAYKIENKLIIHNNLVNLWIEIDVYCKNVINYLNKFESQLIILVKRKYHAVS